MKIIGRDLTGFIVTATEKELNSIKKRHRFRQGDYDVGDDIVIPTHVERAETLLLMCQDVTSVANQLKKLLAEPAKGNSDHG